MKQQADAPAYFTIRDPLSPDRQEEGFNPDPARTNKGDVPPGPNEGHGHEEDRCTLGAACFSAASFIQSKQHEGLQRLRARLLPLPAGTRLKISESGVGISDAGGTLSGQAKQTAREQLEFQEYALTKNDLAEFLTKRGAEWGYYQAADNDCFVRWLVRD